MPPLSIIPAPVTMLPANDIRIEEASFSALPAKQTVLYDNWVIRLSGGGPKRANAVNSLASSTLSFDAKFRYCEDLFKRQHLPLTFRLTGHTHNVSLDRYLEEKGLRKLDESIVMSLDLANWPHSPDVDAADFQQIPAGTWFDLLMALDSSSLERKQKHIELLGLLPHPAIYGSTSNGASIGLGVMDDGYVGLFDIITAPIARRQGYARASTIGILQRALSMGARHAYLQVVADNAAALALYQSLGFTESYRYWYRCQSDT